MKNAVREYLEYSETEKQELWKKATFVFDTNVLLNLYRYSKKTREALLDAMAELKSRIWMPYQVAQEFMKRRAEIIYESCARFNELEGLLSPFREKLRINDDDPEFQKLQEYVRQWICRYKEHNLIVTSSTDDPILERVLFLFDGKVGTPYSDDALEKLKNEGERRYKQRIPPGFKDGAKAKNGNDNNAYGDFIVWKQIIDYAGAEKIDVIFVTDDKKDDWWNRLHGRTIGPRIELRKEFYSQVQTHFHMYTMESFVSHSISAGAEAVDDSIIEEVKAYAAPIYEDSSIMPHLTKLDLYTTSEETINKIIILENEIAALEQKNERRKANLEGVYVRYVGQPLPFKVRDMVKNLKHNIDMDQKRIAELKKQRNYLMHGID